MTRDYVIDLDSAAVRGVKLLTFNALLHSDYELNYHLDLNYADCNLKYGWHEDSDDAEIFDRIDSHYCCVGPLDDQN